MSRRCKRLHPQGGSPDHLRAGALRLGVQEQGRAAAARRGRRLSALARRSRRHQGHRRRHRRRDASASRSDTEPFSMLGFKIMDDPFVGTITFCRVYSGKIESGTTVLNSTKDKKERVGRMLLMHANNREDIKEAYRRRHRRAGRPEGHPHRRHAVRPAEAGHPGEDGVPGAGHRDRDRAEVEGRPGEARRRARRSSPPKTRPSASRPIRNPARPS